MPTKKQKLIDLYKTMKKLEIYEDDLIEKFIMGSGKGGQKTNKTASCVYLKHIPTQIEVKCQKERSREVNRFLARKKLCEHILEKVSKEKTPKQKLIEKIRKQKKKQIKRQYEKILQKTKNDKELSEKEY